MSSIRVELQSLFVRNREAGTLLEHLGVAAVATVLAIRALLALTRYPQLGGGRLHIAHMLWGGLGLLVALVLCLAFLGKRIRLVAAVIGGMGFGAFIDELGKFITKDNDYFFRPTIALIYVTFILMFLVFRKLGSAPSSRPVELLANGLDWAIEAVTHPLDPAEKQRAVALLRAEGALDPRLARVADALDRQEDAVERAPGPLRKLGQALGRSYRRVIQSPHFVWALPVVFTGYALLFVVELAQLPQRPLGLLIELRIASAVLAGAFLLIGVARVWRSRLHAYQWFRRGVLVSIFLTQVFMFQKNQLLALWRLAVSLVVLAGLNYLIGEEERGAAAIVEGDEMAGTPVEST